MTPNPKNIGAAPEEYPIRALVKVCAISMGSDMPGRVFKWKRNPNGNGYLSEPGRYDSRDPSDFPFQWCAFSDELIIDPTPEQIAKERAKAGLPPQEGEALPEPSPAKGTSEVTQPGEGVDLEDPRSDQELVDTLERIALDIGAHGGELGSEEELQSAKLDILSRIRSLRATLRRESK